ncbi:hypothetical protein KR093_002731, partial [Drosophila rubida]
MQRHKRTLTTICVEIQPNGPQNEPYFMCKGADFANDPLPAPVPAAVPQPYQPPAPEPTPAAVAPQSVVEQPGYSYGQPLTPFPSFPSFAAGFFHTPPSYEAAPATPPSPSPTPSSPPPSAGAAAAAFPPAPAAQPYGLPAVPYPAAGGPAATARGAAAVAGPATAPAPHAAAAPPKHKSSHAAASIGDARHRLELDDSVLGVPNVGFQHNELRAQYRQPFVGAEPPLAFRPLTQPAAVPHPHYDDPIMRTFYASLGHQEPLLGQAAPNEPLVAQVAPAPAAVSAPASYQAAAPELPKSSDGNACNSCNRPCAAPVDAACPSYQPVIIAMPCYGQQQPTHYLAVPGQAPARSQEPMLGSAFGGAWPQAAAPFATPFHMPAQQLGAPFGMPAPQVGAPFGMPAPHGAFSMPAPQVGASFGVQAPQVGAPFGLPPVLNPFGPFGSLNPFNPFNRILGAAAPTTPQPRQRFFGAPDESSSAATSTTTTAGPQLAQSTARYSTSPTRTSTPTADASVGASREADAEQAAAVEDDEETTDAVAQNATELPSAGDTTQDDASEDDADQSKSAEAKAPT